MLLWKSTRCRLSLIRAGEVETITAERLALLIIRTVVLTVTLGAFWSAKIEPSSSTARTQTFSEHPHLRSA
jgi:hypothetical protein